jgi:hypothetical protein
MKKLTKLLITVLPLLLSVSSQAQFDTIGYDNGEYSSSIYSRNYPSLYWGITIPPGELSSVGDRLTAVMLHSIESYNIELAVYSGSEYSPLTLLVSQEFLSDSASGWNTITLNTPLDIDTNNTLWITFHKDTPVYAGDYCSDIINNHHASWMSDDGNTWFNAVDYGFGNPFMIRAIFIYYNESLLYAPKDNTKIHVHGNRIAFSNTGNLPIWIYSIDGRCILNGKRGIDSYKVPDAGIYVVRIGTGTARKIAVMQ